MKKNLIMLFFTAIVFYLIGYNVCKYKNGLGANNKINSIVGIYYNSNWNGHDATLILNKDFSCQYPNTDELCSWSIDGNTINLLLKSYVYNSNTVMLEFNTLEECQRKSRGECIEIVDSHILTVSENGISLHDHYFKKG